MMEEWKRYKKGRNYIVAKEMENEFSLVNMNNERVHGDIGDYLVKHENAGGFFRIIKKENFYYERCE